MTVCQTRHNGASVDCMRFFSTLQEVQKRGLWRHSLPRPFHKLKTLAGRVEVFLTKRFQVQRFTNACESRSLTCSVDLDSCQKRRNIWVCVALCSTRSLVPSMTWHILLFAPEFDRTSPLENVSQEWIHLQDDTLRALPVFLSPVRPSQTCFTVLACRGFWNTRVIRGRVTCQESKLLRRTASHGLRPGGFLRVWITVQKADVVSSWKRGQQGFACAGTGGRCSATVQKHVHPEASAPRSEYVSSRATPRLSFALAMVLTMNARRSQRTHLLSDMGSLLNASKDTGMGVIDFAHICGSESTVDAVHPTVVDSACAGLELDAGSGHKVRSSDVCSVGDTRYSFF